MIQRDWARMLCATCAFQTRPSTGQPLSITAARAPAVSHTATPSYRHTYALRAQRRAEEPRGGDAVEGQRQQELTASTHKVAAAAPAAPDVAADLLADVCAELGARFETTDPDEVCLGQWALLCETFLTRVCSPRRQAYLWEDDYLDVVAEGEDVWGREAQDRSASDIGPPSPLVLDAAPVQSAYASAEFRCVGIDVIPRHRGGGKSLTEDVHRTINASAFAESLRGTQPPAVLDVGAGAGHTALRDALRASQMQHVVVLHVPLAQLTADAVASGVLDAATRRGRGIVCVGDTSEAAAQAQVRLSRVCRIPNVQALDVDLLAALGDISSSLSSS